MGASIKVVMTLLSRETTLLLGLSALLSRPAYFGIRAWLQKFTYHLNFHWGFYFLVLILRAASANPVESLRYE